MSEEEISKPKPDVQTDCYNILTTFLRGRIRKEDALKGLKNICRKYGETHALDILPVLVRAMEVLEENSPLAEPLWGLFDDIVSARFKRNGVEMVGRLWLQEQVSQPETWFLLRLEKKLAMFWDILAPPVRDTPSFVCSFVLSRAEGLSIRRLKTPLSVKQSAFPVLN